MKPKLTDTIETAKEYLHENWREGVDCPACSQLVKLYKRKLTSGMAKALIRLYLEANKSTTEFIHITQLGHLNGGEFAQLKRWGLILDEPNDDTTKRTSGMWSITKKGVSFVQGKLEVPKYIFTYNMLNIEVSEEKTDIRDALGNKFDYEELMQGAY